MACADEEAALEPSIDMEVCLIQGMAGPEVEPTDREIGGDGRQGIHHA
ncbi:hypothetical protein [Paenibacillus sp. J2TS4]|nr:hypothetical protein [Paenibacillus sp. J2TS4]GIP32853.1 hypothetical protein J2TS4_20630 [Paenibacillus sp. J2TS4]